ncbi:hypothetical protein GCM10010156_26810 [Planobispora rosea]|uniref:Uncharacterized protein n=1 Tax=Planobispora rosea TaxID=35762 RepID=A0A8J3S106_PLARO|nr:hypothetical protein [Planobispora rosea]GGS66585.1 hypothetical protein GCM10010156_26810 [Planobispora rosea]GIH85043.1 hypothetical protein Pro02_34510 [Planobispora rosea]
MTVPQERDNLDLAATAQEIADGAQAGSLDHAAAASVAITCATTRDLAHARSVLDGVTPDDVRRAALELFERLSVQDGRGPG